MSLDSLPLLHDQAFIDGRWTDADDGAVFDVTNPADGRQLARVADVGPTETLGAIEAADAAWPAWRAQPARDRSAVLRRWFELVVAHTDELALLMTLEQGKPLAESRGEVAYGAAFIEWFAEEAKRLYGELIPAPSADRRYLVIRQPIGVAAAITPWNFPIAMITRKCAPALAAGCPVVVKPSELTPLCALALAALAHEAGMPPGVFNVVTTTRAEAVGQVLTGSPIVRKLSFTGSTAVGKRLMRDCADTVKKVSLELGGNAPFIVFDDADLDAAVAGAVASKYRNTGQTCVCANRLLVQDGVYDAFAERLAKAVSGLRVGDGRESGVVQGPLINDRALAKVEAHVADAVRRGARVVCGGRRHALGGTFFEPTLLADVDETMRVAREEIFGPVAPLFRFGDEADAIRLANATPAGLAAYFYSRDIGRIWRMAEALEYGMVGINEGIISTEVAPFGGVKESGLGREGSRHGIDEFTELKYLCMGGLGVPD
jgi:succinate-semialdehyde dehydrogenase/glutarate-semialdehyde dehydrogenase